MIGDRSLIKEAQRLHLAGRTVREIAQLLKIGRSSAHRFIEAVKTEKSVFRIRSNGRCGMTYRKRGDPPCPFNVVTPTPIAPMVISGPTATAISIQNEVILDAAPVIESVSNAGTKPMASVLAPINPVTEPGGWNAPTRLGKVPGIIRPATGMTRSSEPSPEEIAEFIRTKGITKCPTAYLVPITQ